MTSTCCVPILAVALALAAPAAGFQLLTVGKVVRLSNRGDPAESGGVLVVGRDPALVPLHDPRCPVTSAVQVEAYLQSTTRDAVLAAVDLDCARWTASGRGYRYADPDGTVRSVRYGSAGLRIEVKGHGFTPNAGPVAFVQVQLGIGADLLRARVHNFRRNDAREVRSQRPSAAAAAGEAGFWDVLAGDDSGETETIRHLARAVRRDRKDGRSRFLLAMIHLYRFGQQVTDYAAASDAAKADLRQANVWFARATPLLWDEARSRGDSRVPGFAAAATYLQGVVDGDAALREQGLGALARAVAINAFFNVFDYVPVIQTTTAGDPVFEAAFARLTGYLGDPDTLACVITQPEICANAGFAPHNVQGSLTLFGDIYAKHGDVVPARSWYDLASVFPGTGTWPFRADLQARLADPAARVALYRDGDPTNDPPIIGTGPQTCVACHVR
jgi:hypothetical protein